MKNTALIALQILSLCGCGVKGKPEPPLSPPLLGHGKQSYLKSSQKIQIKSKTKNNNQSEEDWNETETFEGEQE